MKDRCNSGNTLTSRQGSYEQSCVWLKERVIANLLSVPMLEDAGYIVYSHTKKDWEVTTPEGVTITFKRYTGICRVMPYIDLREEKTGLAMIQTICQNFEVFTRREVLRAKLAREVQSRIGHLPDEKFKHIIRAGKKQGLKNCPINVKDVSNSLAIYGPNRPILRGTKTRENPYRVTEGRIEIPRDFYRLHKFVTLLADLMFVGGLPFLITSSRHIKLATA